MAEVFDSDNQEDPRVVDPPPAQHKVVANSKKAKHGDVLSSLVWAAILIWAGAVFLVNNLNLLESIPLLSLMEPWSLILSGVGIILLTEVLLRTLLPEYSTSRGNLIWGLIILGLGLRNVIGSELLWPMLLMGAVTVLRSIISRSD